MKSLQQNRFHSRKAGIDGESNSNMQISAHKFAKLQKEIKKVQYPIIPITNAEALDEKIHSFRSVKVRRELSEKIKGVNSYRKVRGDGNCFFRALAFSFFCSFRQPSFNACFKYLNEVNLTCCFFESIPRNFQKFYHHEFLTRILEQNWDKAYEKCFLSQGQIPSKALVKLFKDYPFLDFITVLYFRSLCLNALYKYEQNFKEFLVGSQDSAICTYREETEGVAIELCSKILEINIYIYEIRRNQVKVYKYTNSDDRNITIFLLFNERHYDIIQCNQNIPAQASGSTQNQNFYYAPLNERMKKGTCIECGNKKKSVYVESNLCQQCYQIGQTQMKKIENMANIDHQKCKSCQKTTNHVSEFGICRNCEEIKDQNKMNMGFQNNIDGNQNFICILCHQKEAENQETGLCKNCTRSNQRLTMNYFQSKEKGKRKRNKLWRKLF